MTKLKSCQKLGKKTSKPNKMSKFQKDWLNSKINGSMLVRHFTLLDIKKLLLNKFPEIITISLPTLLRVLRKDLSLSFKKATKLKTKMDTHEKKVWFVRWAALLANLLEETRDILFIDEFKISPLKRDYNTWSQKGKPACLWTYKSSFEISAIVGFQPWRMNLFFCNEWHHKLSYLPVIYCQSYFEWTKVEFRRKEGVASGRQCQYP